MSITDDDTMADYWADVKPHLKVESQQRRSSNRESSADILRRAGVSFEVKNDGAHLIVMGGTLVVDFWPGTGLWKARRGNSKGRGVRGLLRALGTAMPPDEPTQPAQDGRTENQP